MNKRKPYTRSMDGWWKKNPYYVEYVIHESTALFVAAYALVLLVGLVRLGQGEVAWNGWLGALKSPLSLVFHAALLVGAVYHTYSWYVVMPITMPPIIVGGKKLSSSAITVGGLLAVVVVSVVTFVLVGRIAL